MDLYPNPVVDQLVVGIQAGKEASWEVEVLDLVGRNVHKEVITLNEGRNEKIIEASKWPQGTYMVRISNGNARYTQRFVKQ